MEMSGVVRYCLYPEECHDTSHTTHGNRNSASVVVDPNSSSLYPEISDPNDNGLYCACIKIISRDYQVSIPKSKDKYQPKASSSSASTMDMDMGSIRPTATSSGSVPLVLSPGLKIEYMSYNIGLINGEYSMYSNSNPKEIVVLNKEMIFVPCSMNEIAQLANDLNTRKSYFNACAETSLKQPAPIIEPQLINVMPL
mgnify:CR=1 FL=1